MATQGNLENNKGLYAKKEPTEKSTVGTDCDEPECSDCGVYRQKVAQSEALMYTTLLNRIISDWNCFLFRTVGILAVSCLASLVNLSRLEDFPVQQLYLENVFFALIYYLHYPTVKEAGQILFEGHVFWLIASIIKFKPVPFILMTCFQKLSPSTRYYGWTLMLIHLALTYVISYILPVRKVYYVCILVYTLVLETFRLFFLGAIFYIEDVIQLVTLTALATRYTLTENVSHCLAKESLLMVVAWLFVKHARLQYIRNR